MPLRKAVHRNVVCCWLVVNLPRMIPSQDVNKEINKWERKEEREGILLLDPVSNTNSLGLRSQRCLKSSLQTLECEITVWVCFFARAPPFWLDIGVSCSGSTCLSIISWGFCYYGSGMWPDHKNCFYQFTGGCNMYLSLRSPTWNFLVYHKRWWVGFPWETQSNGRWIWMSLSDLGSWWEATGLGHWFKLPWATVLLKGTIGYELALAQVGWRFGENMRHKVKTWVWWVRPDMWEALTS